MSQPEVEEFNEGLSEDEIQERISHIDVWGDFEPTFYQYEWYEHFTQRDSEGRILSHLEGLAVIPRRHGKTTGVFKCVVLPRMLEQVGTYLHVFPTLSQGRGAIWNGLGKITRDPDEQAIPYLELIPKSLWRRKNNTDMSLELINGSIYRIVGARGADGTANHLRGLNGLGIIGDEYGEWHKDVISEIFGPMIAQNGGFIFKIGTPKGENHMYNDLQVYRDEMSNGNPKIRAWHYSCDQLYYNNGERIITDEYIDRELARGVEPEIIQQEYYCNFRTLVSGAYYKHQMQVASDEGRIGRVPHLPDYPVYRFWDLGKNGTNACWDAQFPDPMRINLIGFHQDPDASLYEMHMNLRKRCDYPCAKNFYPWDGNSPESTGMTKVEFVRERGVTEEIEVVKRASSVQEGIEFVKSAFPRMFFDEDSCAKGIVHLKNYVKQVSLSADNFGDPLKNKAIHGADALRTLGTALAFGNIPIGTFTDTMDLSHKIGGFAQFDDLEI